MRKPNWKRQGLKKAINWTEAAKAKSQRLAQEELARKVAHLPPEVRKFALENPALVS